MSQTVKVSGCSCGCGYCQGTVKKTVRKPKGKVKSAIWLASKVTRIH